MNYERMTAPCGRDCFNCPLYLSGKNEKLKKIVATKLKIPLNKTCCGGCREETGIMAFLNMERPCRIYQCAEEKGIRFCCDCVDFPCDFLHPFADNADVFPHNTKVFNLCLIKKMGLESWAKYKVKSVFDTYFSGKLRI